MTLYQRMYGIDWITPRVLNLNFPETEIDTTHTIAKPVYILGKHTEIRRHPQNGDLKTWGKTDTGENRRKQWERSRTTASRNRISPDSQRTISDYQRNEAKAYNRGQNSRSPPSARMEWRPVDKTRETGTSRGLLKRSNIPEETTKSSGATAPENEGARRSPLVNPRQDLGFKKLPRQEAETRATEGGAEKETDMMMLTEMEGSALNKSQGTKELPEKTQEETPQQRKDREAKELDKIINEYADLADQAMTQEMIYNDDLLEEHEEVIEDSPDTKLPVRDDDMEDEQIEALSQMSPEPQISKQKSVSKTISQKESRVEEARGTT